MNKGSTHIVKKHKFNKYFAIHMNQKVNKVKLKYGLFGV